MSDIPNRYLLPAGTVLWRIHSQKTDAAGFTAFDKGPRVFRARFECEPHPGYSAGLDAQTLIADLLLRGIRMSERRFRTVRRVRILGMRASAVPTAAELSLVSLVSTPDLVAANLANDVLFAEEIPGVIREWADRIRERAPWAHGLIWPTEHDRTRRLVVLFGDRCGSAALDSPPVFTVDLDDEYGAVWLNGMLAPYYARVMPPRNGHQ
ncbi:MAG TPA: hypothetical protein VFX16_16575 [Pseudonocardiaceae bacterium]|nr:hypothetical protein [Pseudonocardiaceae bacterium]